MAKLAWRADRRRLMMLAGLLVALTGGLGTLAVNISGPQGTAPETRAVVIALQDVPEATKLDAENIPLLFRVAAIAIDASPETAFASLKEIPTGAVVTIPVAKGAPLIRDQLNRIVTDTNQNGLSTNRNLVPGMVAWAFNAGETGTIAAGVQPLDRVDIAVTYQPRVLAQGSGTTSGTAPKPGAPQAAYTKLLLQDVLVLSMGSNYVAQKAKATNAPPPAAVTVVTLALSREDAVLLKFLRDQGAVVDLLLRPVGDTTRAPASPVNGDIAVERMSK